MALGKAVAAGLAAAAAVPFALSEESAAWSWLGIHLHHVGGHQFLWSWPIFCGVTLIAWALLAVAEGR